MTLDIVIAGLLESANSSILATIDLVGDNRKFEVQGIF